MRIRAEFPSGCTAVVVCDLETFDVSGMPEDELWTVEWFDESEDVDAEASTARRMAMLVR
ncbi:hypothetical protein STSO111631_05750 [Stackebrandtia soli]